MSSRQDRQGARTVADLERKYSFGESFAEVMGIAIDAQRNSSEANKAIEETNRVLAELSEKTDEISITVKWMEDELGSPSSELAVRVDEIYASVQGLDEDLQSTKSELSLKDDEIALSVEGVKSDVASTNAELEKTKSELILKDNEITASVESVQSEVDGVKSDLTTTKSELSLKDDEISASVSSVRADLDAVGSDLNKTKSELTLKDDEIAASVTSVRTDLEGEIESAKTEIKATTDSISLSVSQLRTDYEGYQDEVEAKFELKVGVDENDRIVSMLNASANQITIKSNRLSISSDYFQLATDGQITATGGKIGGFRISDSMLTCGQKDQLFPSAYTDTWLQAETGLCLYSGTDPDSGNAGGISISTYTSSTQHYEQYMYAGRHDILGETAAGNNVGLNLSAGRIIFRYASGTNLQPDDDLTGYQGKIEVEDGAVRMSGNWICPNLDVTTINGKNFSQWRHLVNQAIGLDDWG